MMMMMMMMMIKECISSSMNITALCP